MLCKAALSLALTIIFVILQSQHSFAKLPLSSIEKSYQNEGLNIFLQLTVDNYTNWLSENNLDPSLPISEPTDISSSNTVVELDCQIWNHYVSGITKSLQIDGVSGELLNGLLYVRFYLRDNITLGGEYAANGTVLNSIPLNGSGEWRIVYETLEQEFQFQNFEITSDGYINISSASFYHMTLVQGLLEFQFDGLLDQSAGGFEQQVQESILNEFRSLLYNGDSTGKYPALDSFYEYFVEVFSRVPLSEIIGTTAPPPTTLTTPSTPEPSTEGPTSTITSPTCPPCDCQCTSGSGKMEKHEQEVLLNEEEVKAVLKHIHVDLDGSKKWKLVISE